MPDYVPEKPEAELVFFWHNGLSPIKSEWNITFVIDHRANNVVVFTNEHLGIAFPFQVEDSKEKRDLQRLEILRVAFPKYQERREYYDQAARPSINRIMKSLCIQGFVFQVKNPAGFLKKMAI